MPEDQKPEPQFRTFVAKSTDPTRCGVWDRHPAHPRPADLPPDQVPEVFVSGDKAVPVAATPVVLDALAKGRIVEVSGDAGTVPQGSQGPAAEAAVDGGAPGDAAKAGRR
jgi:hypothetical protein